MKSKNGITLVALVITIVVLLILAGISINLVVGESGLINRTKKSSDNTKVSQMQEALGLAMSELQSQFFEKYAVNKSETIKCYINKKTVNYALQKQGYCLSENGGSKYTESSDTPLAAAQAETFAFTPNTIYYVCDYSNGDFGKDHVAFKMRYNENIGPVVVYYDKLGNVTSAAFTAVP